MLTFLQYLDKTISCKTISQLISFASIRFRVFIVLFAISQREILFTRVELTDFLVLYN